MTILKYGSKLRLAVFLVSTSLSSLQYIFQNLDLFSLRI